MKNSKRKKIILVSSKGGHFAQLLSLEKMFTKYDYLLLTEKSKSTEPLQAKYNLQFLKSRPNINSKSPLFFWILIVNTFLSLKIFLTHFPKVVITTGSHTAVPTCLLAKLLGRKVIYIVSYARVQSSEKGANVIYPIADRFMVQWLEMIEIYPKATHIGGLY